MKKLAMLTVLSLTACAVPPGGYIKFENPSTKQIAICMVEGGTYFPSVNIPLCKKIWEKQGFVEVPNGEK